MSPIDSKRYTADPDPAVDAPAVPTSDAGPLPSEDELAARFRERLRVFAVRRLGDVDAAEDVAQEALHRVVDALRSGRIRNLAALPAFVFETARHVCLQHYRSSHRESRALHRVHEDNRAMAATAPDPFAALVSEARAGRVREALAGLAESDRELLRLLYHDELDTSAAASRLGLSPVALRVRKHRALKRLGELLGEEI